VDTPSGEVSEKSSYYDVSIFSSGDDSQHADIVAVASRGSSPSITELWPDIYKLDEIWCGGTSVVHTRDVLVCGWRSTVTQTFYKNKFFVQIGVHIKMHIKLLYL
jgi:hypothetical protein